MKTKEFDLELAKQGHPLVTRNGRKVTEFKYFKNIEPNHPSIRVHIENSSLCSSTYKDGRFYLESREHKSDLFLDLSTPWEKPLEMGDIVECKLSDNSWEERIYIKEGLNEGIITVFVDYNDNFLSNNAFLTTAWSKDNWRRKSKPSIEIDIKINGKLAKLSDVSEETLLKIREEN